jgi:uncharacterized membrane protein
MTNRMAIALLALIGVMISAYMAAYKFGFLGSIACGTGSCEIVQNSPQSIMFGVPVPVLGLIGYGALFITALLGLQPRFEDERWIAGVLLAGTTGGLLFSVYLSYLEQYAIHAWCRWCIASAVVALLLFLSALPELPRMRRPATAEI